ncbi:MAG: PEP-CTERM sorting domain-containing protein [Armatimonadota bacterium]|nr:PEP-CTERM sorting domain-containing protein [Armatimonadota bacterium]
MNLKRLGSAGVMVLATAGAVAQFYGGDFDGSYWLAVDFDAYTYDDFAVDGTGWTVTSLYANCLSNENVDNMSWEVRSGITSGNGGTLVASGNDAVTRTATGRHGGPDGGYDEYTLRVNGLSFFLAPGLYYIGVNVGDPLPGIEERTFVSGTTGTNGFGSPIGNGNSWFDSEFFGGYNFVATENLLGKPVDFSYGVVPEPNGVIALGIGIAVFLSMRKRRQMAGSA